MKKQMLCSRKVLSALLLIFAMIVFGEVFAQDQVQAQRKIYGSQLMTDAERTEYQTKMRTFKTRKDREAFRLDHHEKMKARAAEKGLSLPNIPPPGRGKGPIR